MGIYRTIIIDDESIARQRLTAMLNESYEQVQVIAEAKNGVEGAELINTLKPDLIFLDIQMPGKTGFEMLEELVHIPQVVFCTAYEEFALQAFNTLAIDYLVKPVEQERLKLTMDKLNRNESSGKEFKVNELLNLLKQPDKQKTLQSIPHKIGDRVLLIKIANITYFEASDKYVEFYTNDGKNYLTELSLRKLSDQLPDHFLQVQRSLIVNMNFVKEYRKYFRGKYILVLDDVQNTRLETGRSYTDAVKDYLTIT